MKTLFHRLMHWLFPEIPPPAVPKMKHRIEDVPEIVRMRANEYETHE